MKSIFKFLFSISCVIGISLCIISNASAANELDMQAPTLEDYEEVLEKLTKEFGVEFYISPEEKKHFYEKVKNMNILEFEKKYRKQFQQYINQDFNDSFQLIDIQKPIIAPLSITDTTTQYVALNYNTNAYLNSTIFSATGKPGTFTYQKINSYGTTWSHTGFHWHVDSKSYSLSSDKKICTVNLTGHPQDANGVALLVVLKRTINFSAN